MADSAALVAAITGISTLTAGLGGAYVTARQQSEAARRTAEADREKAETERLEKASDQRLETYRELLDAERQLRMLVASGREFTSDQFFDWLANFNRTYNLVVLTGWPGARDKAEELFNELQNMESERLKDPTQGTFAHRFRTAYANHDAALREIRDDLIKAMRTDVGPRGPRSTSPQNLS